MRWVGREVSLREAQGVLYIFAGKESRYDVPPDMSVDDRDWIRRAAGPALVHFGYATKEEMGAGKEKALGGRFGRAGAGGEGVLPDFLGGLLGRRRRKRRRG